MGLGGAQNVVLDLVETKSSEIDAVVWSLSNRVLPSAIERLAVAGVPFRSLALSKINPFGLIKLRHLLVKESPVLLQTHLQFSNIFGTAAANSLDKDQPLIVNHIHNDPYQEYTAWQRRCIRFLVPKVGAYVVPSTSVRDKLNLALLGKARHIEIIPPGLNLKTFDETNTNQALTIRFRKGAKRVIGTVGRIAAQKALHILLTATPSLLKEEPDTRVLIVGEGPLRQTLEKKARSIGVSHAVTFAGYHSDPVPLYRAMDVFVLPSRYEGFGIALIEAMALGVPVIATRIVGVVDVVQDKVTGLLVPFGDSEALSSAILRLFSEPILRQRLRDGAIRFVKSECSRERMAAKMEELYFKLHANKRTIESSGNK
jgi:glycosyltransferase involved in cell wall biosynthesis